MEEIQIFSNPSFGQIRTITIDGTPYFAAKEVANVLGYRRANDAIRQHVDKADTVKRSTQVGNQCRNVIFINESGVYSLILASKLPQARVFKRWVTSVVLPTIRKTGMYKLEAENAALRFEMDTATKAIAMNAGEKRDYEDRICDLKRRLQKRTGESITSDYSDRLYTVTEIAKMMNMTANRLNKKLEEMGVQTREYGTWYLTERFYGFGYTRLTKCSHLNKYGDRVYDYITKWTESGMKFIHRMVSDIDLDNQ